MDERLNELERKVEGLSRREWVLLIAIVIALLT